MSEAFITSIVLFFITAGTIVTAFLRREPRQRGIFFLISAFLGAITLLMLILSCTAMVATKSVGITTSFGKPTGTLSNGLHLKAPWEKVVEFDAAIQTDNHTGSGDKDKTPCTTVRLAGQSTACVDNSVRWRIKQDAADELFTDYRDFDRVRDSLVTRELGAALNETFAQVDPLAGINTNSVNDMNLDRLAVAVTDKLRAKVGAKIEILNVIIPLVRFDASTEERIRNYQVALADTRIARQREETAIAEARANAALTGSVSNAPNVLVSKCLDILEAARKSGYALPMGFSCWPGQNVPVVASNR